MATWLATLPLPLVAGYSVSALDQTVRTDMEAGASRTRRRTSARLDTLAVSWRFADAQAAAFRTWFEDAATGANGGAAWFSVDLMLATGGLVAVEARFVGAPKFDFLGAGWWTASAQLEVR